MDRSQFFEIILDSLTDGVYILDDRGNYLFVNSAYIQMLNMPKSALLQYNVHDFLSTGQINFCISDIVYREKRQVVMFQDVLDTQNYGRKPIRQMVISSPIFDESGNVQNIVAVVRPLDQLNDLYYLAGQNAVASYSTQNEMEHPSVIARSPAMISVLKTATTVAAVDSAVLLTGESGTGKEVVAQFIHHSSPRNNRSLVVISCASLPENLLEAELFGYEKGAFTGAAANGKRGLFEEADGGTLFLDEINSMPLNLQAKVLRAIETKEIQPVGSNRPKHVDFRLIAATNEDLRQLVEEKRFRSDLYYRLAVIPIQIPPLRERKEDILPLANYFLELFCQKYDRKKVFAPMTMDTMLQHIWPGNVRELKNFVERSVVMSIGQNIAVPDVAAFCSPISKNFNTTSSDHKETNGHLPFQNAEFERMLDTGVSLDQFVERCEREYLDYALQKYGNSYKAAEALGTTQSLIMRRKKKYSL